MYDASSGRLNLLIADSNQMQCQLVVRALRSRTDFQVNVCDMNLDSLLAAAESPIDVALLNSGDDLALLRSFHLAYPEIAKIIFLTSVDPDSVVSAFRAGAQGLFCFANSSLQLLCKCIQSVHDGQVWASNQCVGYLVDAVSQISTLRVVNTNGATLLTPREEQVVALVADGLGNRAIAAQLGLSEHTIKKYLFRIFDKLGVSSRVELVLYAVNSGASRKAEWIPV